jgi:L-amino acid N-acyltransferase YncA
MTRTRSEYLLTPIDPSRLRVAPVGLRPPTNADRQALAELVLAAYHGTIDDEGETLDDALGAADLWLRLAIVSHSVVLEEGDRLIAASFVVSLEDRLYIDPVIVAASAKQRGIGASMVSASIRSLHEAAVGEVGATITDGNEPSERLFASLGFVRVGAW